MQVKQLKKGEYFSLLQNFKVEKTDNDNVYTEDRIRISNDIVEEKCHSASQYEKTVELSKTEMAKQFANAHGAVFTVVFRKLPKNADLVQMVKSFNNGSFSSTERIKEDVENFMKGDRRTLIGYMINPEHDLGRALVHDLENNGPRLVDYRTIESLIFKNIKYVVK